jgi:lipopolysaccharide export LptBFGC system permease protein LptF
MAAEDTQKNEDAIEDQVPKDLEKDLKGTLLKEDEASTSDGGEGDKFIPITTQEEFDRLFNKRWAKEKAKYDGFEELKAKAQHFNELNGQMQELQAKVEGHQESLTAKDGRIAELEGLIELGSIKQQIASEHNINAAILRGSSRDELEEHANQIATTLAAPYVSSEGKNPSVITRGKSLAGALERL